MVVVREKEKRMGEADVVLIEIGAVLQGKN